MYHNAKENFFTKDFFTTDPTKVPLYNMHGAIVGIVDISTNFTDKKQKDSGTDLELADNDELSELFKNESNLKTNSLSFGRILLVEDHVLTAEINKQILSNLNYQIDIASNGEMAISLTEKNHYDIIFMDIGLPDINGYVVTQKIRSGEKNKFVPIIGLTAHVGIENKQHCIDVGMNTIFIKPLMQETMEDILDMFVPKYRR